MFVAAGDENLIQEGRGIFEKVGDPNGSHVKFNRDSTDPSTRLNAHLIQLASLERSVKVTLGCLEKQDANDDTSLNEALKANKELRLRLSHKCDLIYTLRGSSNMFRAWAVGGWVAWFLTSIWAGYLLCRLMT